MKKVTALTNFADLLGGVARTMGDTFQCEDKRADYLESLGLVVAETIPEKVQRKRAKKEV